MVTRRNFVSAAGVFTTGLYTNPSNILRSVPKVVHDLGKVKIRDVRTAAVKIKKYKTHLIKITTDSGLFGLGEAFPKAEIEQDIQTIKKEIIGEDPLQVEVLHQKLSDQYVSRGSRTGALCGAISGIEIALWDLAGKILQVPVTTLLGGKYRDKVQIYHDMDSPKSMNPRAWADTALKSREFGFKAIKFSLPKKSGDEWNGTLSARDMRAWIRILEMARKELGDDFPLGVDLHWKYNVSDTLQFIKMAEPLNLWFLEDPIPPENADAFLGLTAESTIPIATGENLYSRQGFRPFIEKRACDIIQPDAQKCGGLLETKKIADWAALYSMKMLCHNGCTPVGTMASGHACAAIKSCVALESDSMEVPYWQDFIVRSGPVYQDGHLPITEKPGLGIELNEEVCREHLAEGSSFF